MAGSDFTENSFGDPNHTTDEPIALHSRSIRTHPPEQKRRKKNTDPKDTDRVERAVRGPVGLDHTEHAVKLPVDEEDDEQMVGVPEALKVGPAPLLDRKPDHDSQREPHDPTGDTRAGCEVG